MYFDFLEVIKYYFTGKLNINRNSSLGTDVPISEKNRFIIMVCLLPYCLRKKTLNDPRLQHVLK